MPQRIWYHRDMVLPESTIYVGRPSKWGNPFRVIRLGHKCGYRVRNSEFNFKADAHIYAVHLFRHLAESPAWEERVAELRGYDLACWCAPEFACHADVLLEIANG